MTVPFAALLAAADLFAAIHAQDLPQVEQLLAQDPALAGRPDEKDTTPVAAALSLRKGEGFLPRRENRILAAILARNPPLRPQEVAAVGTAAQVKEQIARQPGYVRETSRIGWTPLHYAAFNDNAETALALLAAGADVNARAKNKFDNTPLQVALLTSSREAARVLLAHGADVNARQAEGITALHEAASSGDVELVRMLLAAGADPRASSGQFGTPRDVAVKNRHDEAARLLEVRR